MSIALKYIHTDGDVRSNIYLIFNTYLDVSDNVGVVGTAIDCLSIFGSRGFNFRQDKNVASLYFCASCAPFKKLS